MKPLVIIFGILTYLVLEVNRPIKVPTPEPVKVLASEPGVVELPEDGKLYYTSLFFPTNWQENARCRDIAGWFDTNDKLRSLKSQTKFKIYTEEMTLYRDRYKQTVEVVPCICLNDSTGKVLYIARDKNIPTTASGLSRQIISQLDTMPGRRRRECVVVVQPQAEPEPAVEAEPDVEIKDSVIDEKIPVATGLLVILVGLAVGAYSEYRGQKS